MFNQNLNEWLNKFKVPIALSLVGIVLIIGGSLVSGFNKSKPIYPKESIVDAPKEISVDVSGAVVSPGVYKLNEGARIEDAIAAAGGLSEKANGEYISKFLNMAQKLSDGTKVYVPTSGDSPPVSAGGGSGAGQGVVAGTNIQGKVNINTGTQAELEALPGIGPVTASKIISNRPYKQVEDLLNLKIVNKSTFEKIKDSLVLY